MTPRRVVHVVPPPDSEREPAREEEKLSPDLVRIARFLERLAEAKYFGKVTLSLQNGKITDVRTEQVMKLDDL